MKLMRSYPTEIFVNTNGHLVIKQECFECGQTAIFLLSPEQTTILFDKLPQFIEQQKEAWTGVENEQHDQD